jgi:hypothetical protein
MMNWFSSTFADKSTEERYQWTIDIQASDALFAEYVSDRITPAEYSNRVISLVQSPPPVTSSLPGFEEILGEELDDTDYYGCDGESNEAPGYSDDNLDVDDYIDADYYDDVDFY